MQTSPLIRWASVFLAMSLLGMNAPVQAAAEEAAPSQPHRMVTTTRVKFLPHKPVSVLKGKVIVVDPGHGGIDGGASSGTVKEKFVVLDIGLRLEALLASQGATVRMTRDHDIDVSGLFPAEIPSRHRRDLRNRAHFIREQQPAVAVSLHANFSTDRRQSGPITFYPRNDERSKAIAETIQTRLNEGCNARNHALPARYYLLRTAKQPTVLIEVGFLSHPSEREKLKTTAYRQKIAQLIAEAIEKAMETNP